MQSADTLPLRHLPRHLRSATGIAAIVVVYLIAHTFDDVIDDGSLFLSLATAVLASAWFSGTGPALSATVAGAVLGGWDFPGATAATERATQTHLALFVVHGLLLTALVAELRSARRVAEQRARDAYEARRESEAASRVKDEFLATVSHELRTPLNAVLGWVHLLRTGKLDQSTSGRGLESIERNARIQAQLTANLLDVSKALTGMLRISPRRLSMGDIVRDAIHSAQPAALAKDVQLRPNLTGEASVVLGDPTRIRQIAWHLISNAIKFTSKAGVVDVVLENTPDQVVLTISDNGPGIRADFLPRVFDRFSQADVSPTRTAGGLGVGLSLVRQLVEMHGGEIHARNREDRTGAIFTVRLPRQPGEATAEPAERTRAAAEVQPGSPLEGLRVLVLDRDPDARELLRIVLQQRGASVRTVASVADALEWLESWRPDALITDSASPDNDSYALVGKVQWLEAERGGRIPAAALTAYARTDERVRQMLATVQRDLPKPVEPAVLTAEIASLTGRERRRAARLH